MASGYVTDFPSVAVLWQGCVLAAICDAIAGLEPELQDNWYRWDGKTFVIFHPSLAWGVISFETECVVGLLFHKASERSPFPRGRQSVNQQLLLAGMGQACKRLYDEIALPKLIDTQLRKDSPPVFTAAFWSNGTNLTAAESWDQVMRYSVNMLRMHLLPVQEALSAFAAYLGLTSQQSELALSVWKRRVASKETTVYIDAKELALVTREAHLDTKYMRDRLAELHIVLPG